MGESSEYKIMADKKVRDKLDADIQEFIVMTKVKTDIEKTMEIETTESLTNNNNEFEEHANDEMNIVEDSSEHFVDNLNSSGETNDDFFNQSASSVMLDETQVKQEWLHEVLSLSEHEDDEEEIEQDSRVSNAEEFDENSDEETIATFITSTGQQLALYAVEDSDEVFAVAVYSESGEPPTNFQFLMKADVERLIGEGAVRTVKKPQQMKKQTYQGELMTSRDKEMYRRSLKNSSNSPQTIKKTKPRPQKRDNTLNEYFAQSKQSPPLEEKVKNVEIVTKHEVMEEEEEEEEYASINDELTYQDILDNSYFLLDQESVKGTNTKSVKHDSLKMQEQTLVNRKSEDKVEKSTVQYILFDEDQSDSELTFDEIQKSLQHFDESKRARSLLKKSTSVEMTSPEKASLNGLMSSPSSREVKSLQTPITKIAETPSRCVLQASSVVKHKYVPNALLGRKSSIMESKPTVFIQGSTALICRPISDMEGQVEVNCKESHDSSSKIKRPRKQQLTIVDRADSEIIIQPASLVSEDEEERVPKKRGRRKKRRPNNFKSAIKTRAHFSRRLRAREQQPRIEVIEIDIDNDSEARRAGDEEENGVEYGQRRRKIEEIITIEDGKEKGSSDKENEVIMVGDSDDDEDDDDDKQGKEDDVIVLEMHKKSIVPVLKCDHCNRSFRQKRALDTHSKVCPKSPNTRRRFTASSRGSSTRSNETTKSMPKKQYVCRICQEKFDVVVVLARHVRSHYMKKELVPSVTRAAQLKKKQELAHATTITMPTPLLPQDNTTKRQPNTEQKKKEPLNKHLIWNSKKMWCVNCGRWFASAALFSAHCLQHATKKSEKRIKRCQICKKLLRSRSIYIRHMRMHSNAKQLQKRIKRTLQSTSTKTTLRKRGRPRKL